MKSCLATCCLAAIAVLTSDTSSYAQVVSSTRIGTKYFTTLDSVVTSDESVGVKNYQDLDPIHLEVIELDWDKVYLNQNPLAYDCGVNRIRFDGFDYSTIKIGSQCWFADNLRTTRYSNGDRVAGDGLSNDELSSKNEGAQVIYNRDSLGFYLDRGRLYNFYAATDSRNVCPFGWRVPTHEDFSSLAVELGGELNELDGTGFYDASGEFALELLNSPLDNPASTGTNSTGFGAPPNSYLFLKAGEGGVFEEEYDAWFWTSSAMFDTGVGYVLHQWGLNLENSSENDHYPIRCVR